MRVYPQVDVKVFNAVLVIKKEKCFTFVWVRNGKRIPREVGEPLLNEILIQCTQGLVLFPRGVGEPLFNETLI